MAFYIAIKKVEETASAAVYEFSSNPDEGKSGLLKIDKTSGEIHEIQENPEDLNKRLYVRAARKIFLHHQKGEYPQKTCWAS
jgi:hypothetical protein